MFEHFAAQHRSGKESKLTRQLRQVEWIETGGELGALLLESRLIKDLAPIGNRRLRTSDDDCVVVLVRGATMGSSRRSLPLQSAALAPETVLYGPFHSEKDAWRAVEGKAREAGLCLKMLGREQRRGQLLRVSAGQVPRRLRRQGTARTARHAPAARTRVAARQGVAIQGPDRHPGVSTRITKARGCTCWTAGSISALPVTRRKSRRCCAVDRRRAFDADGYRIIGRA